MDKKQIAFLEKIYDHPMPVQKLCRKCGIDVDTYNREYRTSEMVACFDVLSKGTPVGFEGTARITPQGREAVEIYNRDFRSEIRSEKAIIQTWVSIAVSVFAGVLSVISIVLQIILK